MQWESLKQQLQMALQLTMEIVHCPAQQLEAFDQEENWTGHHITSYNTEHHTFFLLQENHEERVLLKADRHKLTHNERVLIEMLIHTYQHAHDPDLPPQPRKERGYEPLRQWLLHQWNQGRMTEEMPEELVHQFSLQDEKIPILLQLEGKSDEERLHKELKKVLQTFFNDEVLLFPLQDKDWLLLASDQVLKEESEGEDQSLDSMEELLVSMSKGLYEMLVTEWMAECIVTVYYPIQPRTSLLYAISQLKEAAGLGRLFQYEDRIYFPWQMQLERLLYQIPKQRKLDFVEEVFRNASHKVDAEIVQTIEQFFELNCNVSETAKRLYIHRNTLIYRLDKFKQETGLDVRSFHDAVLVKVAMLLYKVTKRQ